MAVSDPNTSINIILLQTILTHALWSTLHVSARYLQVYAKPIVFDSQCILASTKGLAAVVLFLLESTRGCNSWSDGFRKVDFDNKPRSSSDDKLDGSNSSHETPVQANGIRRKQFILLIAVISTCRASMNIASAKYTHPYNITLIGSMAPTVVAGLDAIFLRSPFPPFLWPTTLISVVGVLLIAVSQSTHKQTDSINYNIISPRDNAIGCSLQVAVVILNSCGRILQKYTEHILTASDIVQTGNVSNCIFPLLYTLIIIPSQWRAFRYLPTSPASLLAFFTMSILNYCIVSQQQVRLTRILGPAAFSSWTAVRVLCSMLLSGVILGEGIQSWLEWVGIGIMVSSLSVYLVVTKRWMTESKRPGDDDDDGGEEGDKELVPMLGKQTLEETKNVR